MHTRILLLLLISGCVSGKAPPLPAPCPELLAAGAILNPFVDSVSPSTFAGGFQLTLLATEGPRTGARAVGTLELHLDSADMSPRPDANRFTLIGSTQLPLSTIGAAVEEPGAAPPGSVLVRIAMPGDGRSVRGTLGENHPDVSGESVTWVAYRAWNDSTLVGTWRSVSTNPPMHAASGTFCMQRRDGP